MRLFGAGEKGDGAAVWGGYARGFGVKGGKLLYAAKLEFLAQNEQFYCICIRKDNHKKLHYIFVTS